MGFNSGFKGLSVTSHNTGMLEFTRLRIWACDSVPDWVEMNFGVQDIGFLGEESSLPYFHSPEQITNAI
jgi:hypothetical protein